MEEIPLIEEVVLLSLACPARAVARAVEIASKAHPSQAATVKGTHRALAARGFVRGGGLFAKPSATDAAHVHARMEGVWATVASVDPPAGREAELLVLLALTGALGLSGHTNRVHVHLRIADIGNRTEVPPVVQTMLRDFELDTPRQLADALILHPEYAKEGAYDPGITPGAGWVNNS